MRPLLDQSHLQRYVVVPKCVTKISTTVSLPSRRMSPCASHGNAACMERGRSRTRGVSKHRHVQFISIGDTSMAEAVPYCCHDGILQKPLTLLLIKAFAKGMLRIWEDSIDHRGIKACHLISTQAGYVGAHLRLQRRCRGLSKGRTHAT